MKEVDEQTYTLIFFETPHRITDSLEDILSALGNRRICVAREMTKLYEEYWRGDVNGAIEYFGSKEPRGEFTLVIEGKKKEESEKWGEAKLIEAIKKELDSGKSAKEISNELAEQSGWGKKEVYALINQIK